MTTRKHASLTAALGVAVVIFSLSTDARGQSSQTSPAPADSASPGQTAIPMRTSAGSGYTMHQYLLEQTAVAYVVQTAVYPADVNVSNHRANLQGGLDNAAKNMEGGKWASVGWTTHQGLTGVEALGVRGEHAIRSYSVMKGRQIVTLTYAGPPGSARSPDVDRFMASLRVGP